MTAVLATFHGMHTRTQSQACTGSTAAAFRRRCDRNPALFSGRGISPISVYTLDHHRITVLEGVHLTITSTKHPTGITAVTPS